MSLLTILTYPTKSLKEPSVPVKKVTAEIQTLVHDLFETMQGTTGIGLAAPQVGNNITLFVMDVPMPLPDDAEQTTSRPLCFINPQIVHQLGTTTYEEGCLSCPDLLVNRERASEIDVEALDADGKEFTIHLTGLEAICAQHEMDHLKGILLVDHLSRLKRDMYRKQMVRRRLVNNVP
ncbi:MAG: hypothetical protein ACD_62C00210G0004 [uncultured bacterium]|nr:MAG: hypothetical protein ACD_62C00210G0004 [uncultured bacterium]HLD46029.1 peptide deformylase [bacterium]